MKNWANRVQSGLTPDIQPFIDMIKIKMVKRLQNPKVKESISKLQESVINKQMTLMEVIEKVVRVITAPPKSRDVNHASIMK